MALSEFKSNFPDKLNSIELFRAASAILVVLFHTETVFLIYNNLFFSKLFNTGYRGIDLFFVISGFIIFYIHSGDLNNPSRLSGYIYNRITRIYPAMWIISVFALVTYSIGFGGGDKATKLHPAALMASVFLLPQRGDPLVNVTWTLTYEVFFYAVFAVSIINRRVGLLVFCLWQAAVLVISLANWDAGFLGYYFRPLCLDFSVGAGCSWYLRHSKIDLLRPLAWWILLGAGIASFIFGMAVDQVWRWSGVACALGAGLMIIALVRLEQLEKLKIAKIFLLIGGASYSIYLIHFSALTLMAALIIRMGIPINNAVCLACAVASIIAGLLFDRFADRPMQRWLRRRKAKFLKFATGEGP